jgi:uncharacterized membrane protein
MNAKNLFLLSFLTIASYSCSYDSESDLISPTEQANDNENNGGTTVNYTTTIRPIMQASCVSCHASPPVNGAPFPLINFDQVSLRANAIFTTMNRQSGSSNAMPPSGRLPQATINLLQQWIDAGKPEN